MTQNKTGQLIVLMGIFCLIILAIPELGAAQTTSPFEVELTEIKCNKTVLAPGENATVEIYMKNLGHESIQVFGDLSANPNASVDFYMYLCYAFFYGDSDQSQHMTFNVTNTGELSQDTDVTLTARLFGADATENNIADFTKLPEVARDSFTITFLRNDAFPLEAQPTAQPADGTPSYLWILIILVAVIVIVCVALFVFKRRKKQKTETKSQVS